MAAGEEAGAALQALRRCGVRAVSRPGGRARLDSRRLARRLFGDCFIDCFVATRRREEAVLGPHVGAFEQARYIEVVWGRNR